MRPGNQIIMSDLGRQWALLLVLTALILSVLVLGQIVTRYTSAYRSAPTEVSAFLDALDSSVEENESYDRDLSRVPRLEDKIRLGRLLRDIQKAGDDLREDLNGLLLVADHGGLVPAVDEVAPAAADSKPGAASNDVVSSIPRLRLSARLLWSARRAELSERVRRLDMLRMRFLVMYMSIVASTTSAAAELAQKTAMTSTMQRDPEKPSGLGIISPDQTPPQGRAQLASPLTETPSPIQEPPPNFPALGASIREAIKRRPPLRRITTQAMGHHTGTDDDDGPGGNGGAHRRGWAGVVQELQRSPLMHKRHMSIENAMARSMSP